MYFRGIAIRFRYTICGIDLSLCKEDWACIASVDFYENALENAAAASEQTMSQVAEIQQQLDDRDAAETAEREDREARRLDPEVKRGGWAERAY